MDFVLHKVFSNKCYLCSKKGPPLCLHCMSSLKPSIFYNHKSKHPHLSFLKYDGMARKILQMSKYPPHYFLLLRFLSRYVFTTKYKILYDFLPSSRSQVLLTEVPISGLKMFERGFNQSKIITQELSRITEIADFSLLKRTKDTKPLFEMTFGERQRELRDCMKSNISSKIFRLFGYKNIVIVDDVYTSGSTLNESASALRKEGFSSIYYLTLFTI